MVAQLKLLEHLGLVAADSVVFTTALLAAHLHSSHRHRDSAARPSKGMELPAMT